MFGNRKDPMIDTVQKVMDENARRRQIEADLNEELGIQNRKQLGHEKHDLYDQALSQRINEAVLSPKQKPPFDPDPPRKKRPDEPTTAKGLAKQAMRDMIAKAAKAKPKQNMEEEQIVNERVLYSHSHSDTKVIRKSKKGDKEGSAIEVHKNGKKVATGDYDRGADAFFVNVGGKGQKSFDTAKDVANHFHDIKEEQIDDVDTHSDKTDKKRNRSGSDWASDPRVAKAIKYQINQSGKQREKELKEEEQNNKQNQFFQIFHDKINHL